MTDLEAIKLCAEAMDLLRKVMQRGKVYPVQMGSSVAPVEYYEHLSENGMIIRQYDPLHDDAQAMALVKRFNIVSDRKGDGPWVVAIHNSGNLYFHEDADLNRAIVYCVAKMQSAPIRDNTNQKEQP